MQSSVTPFSIALIVAILAGCAAPRTVPTEVLSRYKRIGVVSVTAQRVERQYIGLTIFSNESEIVDSSAWAIDSMYEQQIFKALSTLGGFEAVIGPYSRAEFLHINDLNGPWDAPAFRGPNWKAVEKSIKEYCAANRVDAIVATFAADSQDIIGGTNKNLHGAGLYARGFGNLTVHSFLYLISAVAMVDCKTADPIAVRELATSQKERPLSPPRKPILVDVSRKPIKQLTDEQLLSVKNTLADLPTNAWEPTLQALFGR